MSIKKILSLVFIGALVGLITLLLVIKSYFEIMESSEEKEAAQETSTSPSSLPSSIKPKPPETVPTPSAPTDFKEPLSAAAKEKWPHINVIGPQDTYLSINVHFDNQKVCSLSGTIEPSVHRPFQGGYFIVDGACQSAKLITRGGHEYKLFGYVIMPDKTKHEISFTTGQQDISNVIEPSIEIDAQGKVIVQLAVW